MVSQRQEDRAPLLKGKLGFNQNAASGKRRLGERLKPRDLLLNELVAMGWAAVQDPCDDEIAFVKHIYLDASQKRGSVLQLLSSPSFGTGLYAFRKSRYTFDIKEVRDANNGQRQLKLSCYDFDAFVVPGSAFEYATVEEMGRERFMAFLLEGGYITEDEQKFFAPSHFKRKEIAKTLPSIILDVIAAQDVPAEV